MTAPLTDEEKKLLAAYEAARRSMDNTGGKGGAGMGFAYGAAYQKLVRAGLAPQIRKKYR